MKIAVIPARAGSKRIPKKNIRMFADKPMIGYSIEAAFKSELFDHVFVSTESDEIAEIARSFGADVPFKRPESLADDYTGTGSIIKHAIDWMCHNNIDVQYVCCIYATAPFVTPQNLCKGWEILENSDKDFAFSVTTFAHPVQRSLRISENGEIEIVDLNDFKRRSQDLEERYHDAAQFYWGKASSFGTKSIHGNSLPVILPRWQVQDIDTEEDWRKAELMYYAMHLNDASHK